MKNILLYLLISLINFSSFSQINFEKGYFIKNNGSKTECLIKNIGWKNNPIKFEYKLYENSESKIAMIASIREFSVLNNSTYKRYLVKFDKSSREVSDLSTNKKPNFVEETIFLKLLVKGKANLFEYERNGSKLFFYSIDSSNAKQLIYKKYITNDNKIAINNKYKQQLWTDLKCQSLVMNDVNNCDYKKSDLINYFIKHNTCKNPEFKKDKKEFEPKEIFHLHLRPGLNFSQLNIRNDILNLNSRNINFDPKTNFRLGLEIEAIIPFSRKKWSIFLEPTYQVFKAKKDIRFSLAPNFIRTDKFEVDYKSIELPIGVRHYFFMNNNSKLFVNGAFISDFSLGSKISVESESVFFNEDLKVSSKINLAFGLGYNYKNIYNVEIRHLSNRKILKTYNHWTSDYSSFSIIFGYNFIR